MKQTWRWFGPDDPVTLAHVQDRPVPSASFRPFTT